MKKLLPSLDYLVRLSFLIRVEGSELRSIGWVIDPGANALASELNTADLVGVQLGEPDVAIRAGRENIRSYGNRV
jgi:hypothetical protein